MLTFYFKSDGRLFEGFKQESERVRSISFKRLLRRLCGEQTFCEARGEVGRWPSCSCPGRDGA